MYILWVLTGIFGIIALVKGKFSLTHTKVVRGGPAYAIAILLILPFPLSFAAGVIVGIILGIQNRLPNPDQTWLLGITIELSMSAGLYLPAILIGIFTARNPEKERLKHERAWDDEDPAWR